jgi:hypothetical protein
MADKPCTTCGSPGHSYCSKDGSYILGHAKFFGAIIGKCSICNCLIGSAIGRCDTDHTPWRKDDGTYHRSMLIQMGPSMDVPVIDPEA